MKFTKKESTNYWRIIIGPWLIYFTQIIYERYKLLISVQQKYSNLHVCLISHNFKLNISSDLDDFYENAFSDD